MGGGEDHRDLRATGLNLVPKILLFQVAPYLRTPLRRFESQLESRPVVDRRPTPSDDKPSHRATDLSPRIIRKAAAKKREERASRIGGRVSTFNRVREALGCSGISRDIVLTRRVLENFRETESCGWKLSASSACIAVHVERYIVVWYVLNIYNRYHC